MTKVIVIGGGPAGIMAAITACRYGCEVFIWERNSRLGRKLAITGKGRCNITNNTEVKDVVSNLPGNGSFLYGALSRFSPQDTMDFFCNAGLELKTERGRRVFPQSDRAADVVDTLVRSLNVLGVKVHYERRAKSLLVDDSGICGVVDYNGRRESCDCVVIATGGVSYPLTGSTGDGYKLAARVGHTIIEPKPSLVPLETRETWPAKLSGLSLRNVEVSLWNGKELIGKDFGEMLFTHFGVSGPIILSLSQEVTKYQGDELRISINTKPALNEEKLQERLQRDLDKFSRKNLINALADLLPKSLIPVVVELSGIPESKPANQINRQERLALTRLLMGLPLTVKGVRPISEAIVTAGGVSVKEVNPKTMQSRICRGLFFAGEVLDVDGYTGGYNLQAAWSSGYVAGCAIGESQRDN